MNGDPVDWAKGAGFIVSVAAAIAILWKAGQTIVRVVTGVIRTLYHLPYYLSNIAHASSLSKANTEILLERLSVARWDADDKGHITNINRVLTKLTGWTLDDVAGNNWKNIIHPEDLEALEAAFNRTITDRVPLDLDIRWRTVWGSIIHGRSTARWERNGKDYIAGAFDPSVNAITEIQAVIADLGREQQAIKQQVADIGVSVSAWLKTHETASDTAHKDLQAGIAEIKRNKLNEQGGGL